MIAKAKTVSSAKHKNFAEIAQNAQTDATTGCETAYGECCEKPSLGKGITARKYVFCSGRIGWQSAENFESASKNSQKPGAAEYSCAAELRTG
jgi:hypothetical protein